MWLSNGGFQVQTRSDHERRRESYNVRGKNLLDFRRTLAVTNKTKIQWTAWDGVGLPRGNGSTQFEKSKTDQQ
jgi:hypothetical protein